MEGMMQVPPEISFHQLPEGYRVDARRVVTAEVARLERIADLISCRVAVEESQQRHRTGNRFRVRVEVSLPAKDLVAVAEDEQRRDTQSLLVTIRQAFRAMERQVKAASHRRRGEVKRHDGEEMNLAIVVRLFPQAGYGFVKDVETEEEIYVHEHAVTGGDFGRLEEGTQVRYTAVTGEEGPQASSVHIVEKPGVASGREGSPSVEPPLGWSRRDRR
jgi:cold shock CspA family protein/ribosome-associated translation inhibitor RaiA